MSPGLSLRDLKGYLGLRVFSSKKSASGQLDRLFTNPLPTSILGLDDHEDLSLCSVGALGVYLAALVTVDTHGKDSVDCLHR